jgi:hypothetical protein
MKFIKIIFSCILILSISSCKKWLDINTDPSNPQVATGEVLIAPIQFQMANNLANDYRFLFKYVQYWGNQSADPSFEKHGYDAASDNGGSIWRMTYYNHGKNLELMIKDGEDNQKWSFAGIGYAIKAWDYQVTTDFHGPIILDEAFDPAKLTFVYQDQPEVYEKVREWSYKALDYLSRPDVRDYTSILSGVTGDQIYKGDRLKWKKFVYGLLALQYSHLRNKPQFATAYADSVIKYVDLSFTDEGDDATIFFNASNAGESNPFGTSQGLLTYTGTSTTLWSGRVAQPIVSYLTGGVRGTPVTGPTTSLDPRLTRMIAPNTDNIYRGVVPTYGDPNATKRIPHVLGSVAAPYPGKYIFADKARFPIMTYSQLQFAEAEAYLVKNKPAEAHAAYLRGIDGHMDFINRYGLNGTTPAPAITAAQITAYKTSSEVAQTPAQLTMADIMGQKYIAQWGWAGIEQWCDLRKYHYDPTIFRQYYQLSASELNLANTGRYAYRVRPRYNSEYVWNRDELAKWGGLDADYQTKETWFSLP